MAEIDLVDDSALTGNVSLLDTSVLGKTPKSVMHFVQSDVIKALDQTLDEVQFSSLSMGFGIQPAFSLSGGTAKFNAGGGASGEFELRKRAKSPKDGDDSSLFPKDQFGNSVDMGQNCYLALGFDLSLAAAGSEASGAFTIKPTLTASSAAKLYMPFGTGAGGAYPKLRDALSTLCNEYALPSSLKDVQALPGGSVFTFDGQGCIAFKAQLNILTAVNPTASLGACPSFGPISITAAPAMTLGGGFSLTGDFQVRLWNKDGKIIQLGYYKKMGKSLSVSFDASAGVDVTVGGYDVIAKLYGLLGDSGKLDSAWLKANIPADAAKDVEEAYEAAVQTKLSIAIDLECDTSVTDEAAFSWNFDTSAVGPDGLNAFEKAILGDLSALMGPDSLPAGVTKAGSVLDRLNTSKHTFKFNFLGMFNYADVRSASLDMSTKASDDGQVVITDKATLTRLNATATPMVKSDRLRNVLAEDFVATAGYTSSLGKLTSSLKVNYSYYDYESRGQASDLQIFAATAEVLEDSNSPLQDWQTLIQSKVQSQAASFAASLAYDSSAATALFVNDDGTPRSSDDFEQVGRRALLQTPGLGLNPVFVSFLDNDVRWQKLTDAGAASSVYELLGVDQISPPQWAMDAHGWAQHILDWASAMHSAAQALQDVLLYLKGNPSIDLFSDAGFMQKRQTLASDLKTAVEETPLFNDALGVVTIFMTASPSTKDLSIHYAGQTKDYS